MMAFQEALCCIHVMRSQPDIDDKGIPALEENAVLSLDSPDISTKTRLEWAKLISEQTLFSGQVGDDCGIRDWDFVLGLDGSVMNRAENAPSPSSSPKVYPAGYQIPAQILERLNNSQEKIKRAELFALGSLLYWVLSGKDVLSQPDTDEKRKRAESCFVKGEFPEHIWGLPGVVRILACWCPEFAKDLLAARSSDESFRSKAAGYVKKHPVLFGFQVAGGIASLASIFALPVLGAVGFGMAGPVAGSAAAAWQSSIGLVEAGSIFAWCQSAAMGGAAVGGILATGLAGAGVAVGATVAGAFDDTNTSAPDFREKFLAAWKRDIGEIQEVNAVP